MAPLHMQQNIERGAEAMLNSKWIDLGIHTF